MAGRAGRGPSRVSPVLMALLVGAVVVGLASTFLAAPAGPTPIGAGNGPVPESFAITGAICAGVLLLALIALVGTRLFSGGIVRLTGVYAMLLALFLVGIVFLLLVHYIVPNVTTESPGKQNGTGGSTKPPPLGNKSLPNVTRGPLPLGPVPGWIAYIVLGLGIVAVLYLVAPALARRAAPPEGNEKEVVQVRRSLEEALRALADETSTDPRDVIIALYARLLSSVSPYLENLDAATPREIERVCVDRFDVPATPAADLRVLFEEARYSTHPFTDDQVTRARTALEASLGRLRARSYSGGG